MMRGLVTTALCVALMACQTAVRQPSEFSPEEALARLYELEQKSGISEDLRLSASRVAQILEGEIGGHAMAKAAPGARFPIEPAAPPPDTREELTVFGHVIVGPANLRRRPMIVAERVGQLAVGERVRVTQKVQNWYEIALEDGTVAYVYEELLRIDSDDLPRPAQDVLEIQDEQVIVPQMGSTDALNDAVEEMAREVTAETPSFSQPAFQCHQDYTVCQSQYMDTVYCASAMALCLVDIVLP